MTFRAITSSAYHRIEKSMALPAQNDAEGLKTQRLLDHLFRHESANIKARLLGVFGPGHLDEIEDAVQDALIQAVRRWPYRGIPDRPAAWLFQVARNRMLDQVRRRACFSRKRDQYLVQVEQLPEPGQDLRFGRELLDDQLALIFTCCNPALSRSARIALTLKVACGFSIEEIASAFLSPRATIAQRVVRAKRTLRSQVEAAEVPGPDQIQERLDAVLEALYLMFNEGYSAHSGEELIRYELCHESLRLVTQLLGRADTDRPECRALAALFCFQAARLDARVDDGGFSVILRDQDRSRWDAGLTQAGFNYLEAAENPTAEPGVYHLQAAIAACHAAAPDYARTDWRRILSFYDALVEKAPGELVHLNRLIALAQAEGPSLALSELEQWDDPTITEHFLTLATRAELLEQLDRPGEALGYWQRAAVHDLRPAQRRHLEQRIQRLSRLPEN